MASKRPSASSDDTGKKSSTKLLALSSAAVVAIYGTGFLKTKAAADRIDAAERHPAGAPGGRRGAPPAVVPESAGSVAEARATTAEPGAGLPRVSFELPTRPAPARPPVATVNGVQTTAPKSSAVASTPALEVAMSPAPVDAAAPVVAAVSTPPPVAETALPQKSLEAAVPVVVATAVTSDAHPAVEAVAPAKAASQYKDGTYLGWGTCRHGDIQAQVVIAGGRIASAKVAQCWTRYTCDWIAPVVPQVVSRQSPNIDYVSGATQSVDAFYYAVVEALSKAK